MRTLAKIKTIANARVFKPTSSIREDDDGGSDGGGDGGSDGGGDDGIEEKQVKFKF